MQDAAVLEVFLLRTGFKSYWMLADPSPLEGWLVTQIFSYHALESSCAP